MNQPPNPPTGLPGPYPSYSQHEHHDTAAATAAAALSQEHTPTANGHGRKRKASSAPGSRGVANLTPEQLAKKRANDREAQRAIRERTKNTIDSLANRIKELESQQPFQELQKALQERDRALQECEDLKRKLATVASVVGGNETQQQGQQQQQQPNLHGTFEAFEQFIGPSRLTESDTELAALTAQQSPLPPLHTTLPPLLQHQQPTSGGAPYEQQHIHPDLRSPVTPTHPNTDNPTKTVGPATYPTNEVPPRRWSPSTDHPFHRQYSPTSGVSYEQRLPPPAQMQSQSNGERLGLNYVLEPKPHSTGRPPVEPAPPPYVSPSRSEQPIYSRLPKNSEPSCPLDSLLLDFLANRRKLLAAGVPVQEVAGPEYPALIALHDPDAVYSKACHPVSAFLIDILDKFPDLSRLPEKVAVLYAMFLILRWQICPCVTCYKRIPDWMKPSKEQLEVTHPAWYDHLPWPIMRQRLIATDRVKFEEFFIPFTSKQCLNWPYPNDQILITSTSTSPDDPPSVKMNPVFESHLRNLSNWSLGTLFKSEFPYLIDGSVRIQDTPSVAPG